jgi:hypothetical protein
MGLKLQEEFSGEDIQQTLRHRRDEIERNLMKGKEEEENAEEGADGEIVTVIADSKAENL